MRPNSTPLNRLLDEFAELRCPGLSSCASRSMYCRDGTSNSSSGTTCQRRKNEKSPVARSTDARTSTSSWKRFLVADAERELERAENGVPCRRSSRAPAHPPATDISRLIPNSSTARFRCRAPAAPCPDSRDRATRTLPSTSSSILSGTRLPQHPHEISLSLDRHAHLDACLVAGEAHEILLFPERPIEPRRRHLQPVVVDVLDREHAAQMVAHPGAVLDVDAARLVDVTHAAAPPCRTARHRRARNRAPDSVVSSNRSKSVVNSCATNKKWANRPSFFIQSLEV